MGSSRVAIVSTSINPRPEAYANWAKAGDLIVAGDLNSPPELRDYLSEIGGLLITPEMQMQYAWSEVVGWRNIQRRNAAIMWALQAGGYEYILTVDDDNHPAIDAEAFVQGHINSMDHRPLSVIGSRTGYLNTGIFCEPRFHQRGTPYGVGTEAIVRNLDQTPTVVVSQAQVLGDPDCDAIDRMVNRPDVRVINANVTIQPGTYAAFNSQATMWKRDWAPVMAVLPGVGRYDDIFASFIFARLSRTYGTALFVGEPAVLQVRNEHDLVKDLAAELWGMNHVFTFCQALDRVHISSDMPLWMAYDELLYAVSFVLPRSTMTFAKLWTADWRKL